MTKSVDLRYSPSSPPLTLLLPYLADLLRTDYLAHPSTIISRRARHTHIWGCFPRSDWVVKLFPCSSGIEAAKPRMMLESYLCLIFPPLLSTSLIALSISG